jgi:Ca2+-binding RTX toxin-like protein
MTFPTRRAGAALLAGCATLAVAAPAEAAPNATFNTATGELAVSFSGTDAVTVAASGANVSLNGVATAFPAADVRTITVTEADGGTGDNTIDLSSISAAGLAQLTGTTITARGGVDTITGSQIADRIVAGTQDDIMRGADGNDTLVWNPGEGSDTMDGGNGVDTIENNGGGIDENFKASPLPNGGFRFERVSPSPFVLTTSNAERLANNMAGGNDTFTADLGLAALVVSTINGGDGNDRITGTDGNDTLNGGTGNDIIDGARGNDAMNGEDGDDLLIWNNGDGSDRMEGGAGTDVAQDNGAPAGDQFVVTANNGRVSAVRTNLGLFFLDIGTSETLDINGLAGDDRVDVGPGLGGLIKVDYEGGDGNDLANIRNDSSEKFAGGAGTDTAVADASDAISETETVDVPDTTAPAARIATKQAKFRKGAVKIKVRCPDEARCKGTLRILRKGKTIGRSPVNVTGAKAKTYTIKLNKATRTQLRKAKKGKRLAVRVQLAVTDAAGNAGSATAKLTIRK